MSKNKPLQMRVDDADMEFIEGERLKMEKCFPGIKITVSDAVRYLIRADRKNEARIWDLHCVQIQSDIAEHLHLLKVDGDEIVRTIELFRMAHEKAREERNRRLGIDKMEATDIVPGRK